MWDRKTIKGYAKQELKQSYWLSFAVCLVAGILGAGGSGSYSRSFGGGSDSGSTDPYISNFSFDNPMVVGILVTIFTAIVFGILIGLAVSVFLSNPVRAGQCSFFVRAPYGDRQFTNLFSAFKAGRYMATVKTMLLMNLYIFLWSLLFIIPGIIKSYQYRMVPYIISDDPSLSPSQAMDLSRRMTDGEKFDMFILDLSFIGWYLLGALALGIGVLFVNPYFEATYAQLYLLLRMKVTIPPPQYGQFSPEM